MWSIKGKPQIIKTIALMQVGEEGSINAEDILLSTKGELCINLDAPLGEKLIEEEYYDDIESDDEDNEEDDFIPIWDEYLFEEFSIRRTSKKEDWYEIDIHNKLIKPVSEKTFNTIKTQWNYVLISVISNFQNLLQKALITNPEKNTRTLEAFSQLTKKEKHNLKKVNLEVLLTQAQQKEEYELAGEIRDILQEKESQ